MREVPWQRTATALYAGLTVTSVFILFIFLRGVELAKGERMIKSPRSLNVVVFNVHGCTTHEVKKSEMFL